MDRTSTVDSPSPSPAQHLLGWDCIEFWVGNARTTAGFLMSAFGFHCTGYAGPETGRRDKASYVLEQGDIRFVVSGALDPDSPIAEHVRNHGDGVHDLAWLVDDAAATYDAAIARGARSVREPWTEHDEHGDLELAQVAAYGETVHTFVNRRRYRTDVLEPGYTDQNLPNPRTGPDVGLVAIDHVVGNVAKGELDTWVDFYADVMGFAQLMHFDDEQIRTEYSALMSTVVWDGSKIVMPINEPADGLKKSQIQEYIEHYRGPGVQHLALRTTDIVNAVQALRDRGVRFMSVPDAYYDEAKERLAPEAIGVDLPWADLQRLNILADKDHDGYLLQIFTETITDRPAVFIEIIERHGAKGFGEGNFKALFEAIERDQAALRQSVGVRVEPSSRIAGIPVYRPGKSADAVAAEHGLGEAIKLASNESPFGPLPGVAEAVAASITSVNRYADHTASAVAARYAEHVGVDRDRIAVGAGSVGLIEQLALSFVAPGDEVVYPWPSFIAYPQFTSLAGGTAINPALRRQAFDVDALVDAITDRTRVVLLANPNNPTGTALRTGDLQRIVAAAPGNCLVVIDEAYHEFVTGADVPDAIELVGDRPNVAVLRTLSKAYGLAGLRIGFMVADPQIVDAVNASSLPFAVNAAAQAAGLAALDQGDEVARRCSVLTTERTRVAQELRRRGLGAPDSQANFWWLAAAGQTAALGAALERLGVVTRPLDGGVRVSIGTPVENDRFLAAFDEVRGGLDLEASWDGATGDAAVKAAGWLGRLDAAMHRFRDHLAIAHPGRTAPVPGEHETWEAGQVWAHVAEFGDFWLDQLDAIFREPSASDPIQFGRTRRDAGRIAAIEAGRHEDPASHLATVERSADRLAALVAGMTNEDWSRTGAHETLGVMDLDAQLSHFHVGHYEEHADQLDTITSGAGS